MINQICLTSLICFGFFAATRYTYYPVEQKEEGQVLGFIKKYGDKHLPLWIRKPLYDCPTCMGSFWTLVTCSYFGLEVLLDIVPMILATSGFNFIIWSILPDEV